MEKTKTKTKTQIWYAFVLEPLSLFLMCVCVCVCVCFSKKRLATWRRGRWDDMVRLVAWLRVRVKE